MDLQGDIDQRGLEKCHEFPSWVFIRNVILYPLKFYDVIMKLIQHKSGVSGDFKVRKHTKITCKIHISGRRHAFMTSCLCYSSLEPKLRLANATLLYFIIMLITHVSLEVLLTQAAALTTFNPLWRHFSPCFSQTCKLLTHPLRSPTRYRFIHIPPFPAALSHQIYW